MRDSMAGEPGDDSQDDIRRLVAKRLAMAAGLVVVLLGGLAVFDHLTSQAVQEEIATYEQPVPVARKEMTQPVTVAPSEPVVEEKDKLPVQSIPEGTAGLNAKEAQVEPPPPADSVAEGQGKPVREGGRAAPTSRAASAQARPAATPSAPMPSVPPPAVAQVPAPSQAMPRSSIPDEAAIAAGAPRPTLKDHPNGKSTQYAPVAPTPVAPPVAAAPLPADVTVAPVTRPAPKSPVPLSSGLGAPPRLMSGFVLQAGVFSSTKGAEELHAKLNLHGIPSTLETRVHVGPFKTKAEAEAAQHKMQALGIDPVLLAPKGSRR